MHLSGLIPRPMNADNDRELLGLGIGFTNIVDRTTRASQELSRQEIEEGTARPIVINRSAVKTCMFFCRARNIYWKLPNLKRLQDLSVTDLLVHRVLS